VTKRVAAELARHYRLRGPRGDERTYRRTYIEEIVLAGICRHWDSCGRYEADQPIPWRPETTFSGYPEWCRGTAADGIVYSIRTGRAHLGAEKWLSSLDHVGVMQLVEQISRILQERVGSVAVGHVPQVLNTHPAGVAEALRSRYCERVDRDFLEQQRRFWAGLVPLTEQAPQFGSKR